MSNQEAIALLRNLEDALDSYCELNEEGKTAFRMAIEALSCSENPNNSDCISRAAAIEALDKRFDSIPMNQTTEILLLRKDLRELPSAQPEKETAKRVLWTGWKGTRDTRYKCPNCKKPVKNDDVYCHRCGQKLMFPHISFTDYIPGEKQELIVRWDDERSD